ncbi:MAG TPA: hypothetical protein VJK07_02570 [Candidatus Nanoarchaeia archaeon]|nr:hypothetical protein [Candidatus Nanoarchaeia archaeon]
MHYSFFLGKKQLFSNVVETGFFRRGLGLMFRTRNTENLLFAFKTRGNSGRALTAVFVFFPFVVVWLDKRRKVVDMRYVLPWELYIHTKRRFSTILEFPVNPLNQGIISFLRRKIRKV